MFGPHGSTRVLVSVAFVGLTAGVVGYLLGKRKARCENRSNKNDASCKVGKSFRQNDPILEYCLCHSTRLHPVQEKLYTFTLEQPLYYIMGAREVVQLNANIIQALGGKKVLDIGVYTGVSALAAAMALPDDGKVVACEISEEFVNMGKPFWKEAGVEGKLELHVQPAAQTLDQLIAGGEEGTYDFAFIDADKIYIDEYYEKALQLLRKGGIISVDNVLWSGKVLEPTTDSETLSLQRLNEKIAKDERVSASMLNVGDGLSIVVKL